MKIPPFLSGLFDPVEYQDVSLSDIAIALTSLDVRTHWLKEILAEIQHLNVSIDTDLLQKKQTDIAEKSARRRALQFVLEQVLSSKRAVEGQQGHNSKPSGLAALLGQRPQPE